MEINPVQGKVQIQVTEPQLLRAASPRVVTTDLLGKTYHADMKFEQPDATSYRFDTDFFRRKRPDADVTPGPFELTENGSLNFEF